MKIVKLKLSLQGFGLIYRLMKDQLGSQNIITFFLINLIIHPSYKRLKSSNINNIATERNDNTPNTPITKSSKNSEFKPLKIKTLDENMSDSSFDNYLFADTHSYNKLSKQEIKIKLLSTQVRISYIYQIKLPLRKSHVLVNFYYLYNIIQEQVFSSKNNKSNKKRKNIGTNFNYEYSLEQVLKKGNGTSVINNYLYTFNDTGSSSKITSIGNKPIKSTRTALNIRTEHATKN